jgi:serine/threonine protein kinase/tetratricopeptide (TPR) repeat protein
MNVDDPKEKTSAPNPDAEQTIVPSPALGNSSTPGAATRMAPSPSGAAAPPMTPPPDGSITGEFEALVGPSLRQGSVLAGRYEILKMLGQGGMGAVYKARDRQVDRLVAVKIIRPEMAANPAILQRFIQELVLARQITHRNVIRIYDIGEAEGIKFITMEFVEGKDLRTIISERGKLPAEEAASIIEQTASGLSAAHAEGVIHRDLKPGNIMQDASGRIVVMDFGLARTVAGDGMTQTGMMLGTMEYMSPEQAKAEELDGRSDLYTLGLIFFELLSGQMPFKADSALASLVMRTQQRATPVVSVDPNVPAALSNIVERCLERVPDQRYRSTDELIEDLRAWRGGASIKSVLVHPTFPEVTKTPTGKYIAMAVLAIALLIGSSVFVKIKFFPSSTSGQANVNHPALTLLVADFQNETNDGVFEGTIEPAFGLALEGASFVNSYARGQAQKIANQIKPGSPLDEANARLVATREGINVVISGAVSRRGSGYKISYKAIDAISGNTIASDQVEATDKSGVLKSVGSLASKLRSVLGDTTPESVKLAQQETFTSSSLEAAHEYAVAQDLRYKGKTEQAIKGLEKAISLDSNFGSAYAALAALYWNQGNQAQAVKNYKLAMEHIDRMSDREKYRTRGGYYLAVVDGDKAAEEFGFLVQQFPADSMGFSALAFADYMRHDMKGALEASRRASEIYPKNVVYRNNAALYALYAADFAAAQKEAESVLQINPEYDKAFVTIALAQIAKGEYDAATVTMQKLAGIGPVGASYAANGLADQALYQSDAAKAADHLQKGIADNLAAKNNSAAAKKYVMLAEAQLVLGKRSDATASVNKAVATDKANVLFRAGRMFVALGDNAKASAFAAEFSKEIEPTPQAFGKLLEGGVLMNQGKFKEAIRVFQDAGRISDTWLARYELARAYLAAGAFTEANSQLEICLKRRGETTDIFTDEEQTFRFFPSTYYYLGRVLEGMKSGGAADAYKNFLALKTKDSPDPLVVDARTRAGKL